MIKLYCECGDFFLCSQLGGDGGISASAQRLYFGKELLSFASDNFLPLGNITHCSCPFFPFQFST